MMLKFNGLINLEYHNPNDLKPYDNNAREHKEEDINAIRESIREFGFNDPIGIWSEENLIVEGHGRQMAAIAEGLTSVPCIRLDHLTDEQRRAYALAHNKTAELSMWDFGKLDWDLAGIKEIDMSSFGFSPLTSEEDKAKDWFDNGEKQIDADENDDEYKEFVDKFKTKVTTDDCYTPELVYEAVAEYVENRYGLDRVNFVRPFYPGGDYQRYKYADQSVVVDNPPFSIMAEIINFYTEQGVKFFLFAPALAIMSYTKVATAIALQAQVTYENGAKVPTSFLTNLEDDIAIRTDPALFTAVTEASKEARKDATREIPKYEYPDEVVTAAMIGRWSKYGVEQSFYRRDCMFIRQLDEQAEEGSAIYGSGLLLSEKAAAEKAAAEKAAAEKAAARRWQLSDRERQLVKSLGEA